MPDTDIFKFIPTIIAAVVTFFSTLYSKRSNIHKSWFFPVVKLITILLISQFFISAYDLVKGVNYNRAYDLVIDVNHVSAYDFVQGVNRADYFYLMVGLMAIIYSLLKIKDLIDVSFQKSITNRTVISDSFKEFSDSKHFITVLLILFIAFIYHINIYIVFILIIILFIFVIAISMLDRLISVYFQGHIKINMDNIYYTNSSPISVSIEITGVNDELLIDLRNIIVNKVNQIDKITLGPNLKDVNIAGIYLIGNGFYSGIYHVFINTTDMTEGYYELVCSRSIDKYPYGKSFYLVKRWKEEQRHDEERI